MRERERVRERVCERERVLERERVREREIAGPGQHPVSAKSF